MSKNLKDTIRTFFTLTGGHCNIRTSANADQYDDVSNFTVPNHDDDLTDICADIAAERKSEADGAVLANIGLSDKYSVAVDALNESELAIALAEEDAAIALGDACSTEMPSGYIVASHFKI